MQNDKASRTERNLKQEIETLKLQLGSITIKYKDVNQKGIQDSEFIELYKKKSDELLNKINNLEEQLTESHESLTKY